MEARDLETAKNPPELLEKQRLNTGGKVVCRFPPEPNGKLFVVFFIILLDGELEKVFYISVMPSRCF